jgi:hypothetical protein
VRRKLRNGALIAALAAIGLVAHTTQDLIAQTSLWRHWTCALGVSNSNSNEPTNVQWNGGGTFSTGGSSNPTGVIIRMVDPCEQGDTALVFAGYGSGSDVISAVSDDRGGTLANGAWVKDKTIANAGNGQSLTVMRRSNCPDGLFNITITFTGQTGFINFCTMKVNNLAPFSPVHVSSSSNNTGTSLTAGAVTTTVDDVFWVFAASNTSPGAPTSPWRYTLPAETNDLTATLACPLAVDAFCVMYGMKRSQGSLNPALGLNQTFAGSAIALVAYKTAPGVGSKPLVSYGGRVKWVLNQNTAGWVNGGQMGTSHQWTVPWDPEINGIAITYDDPNSIYRVNIASNTSSSPANTWTATTPQLCGTGGAGPYVGWLYNIGGSYTKAMTVTQVFTSAPSHGSPNMQTLVFGLVGVGAFDVVAGFGDNPNVAVPTTRTNVLGGSPLVPTQRNGLILWHVQEDQQTVGDVTSSTGLPTRRHHDDPGIYALGENYHDGGIGHQYHEGDAGTQYNYSVSYVNYEGGLNLTNLGGQWIAFTSLGPLHSTDYSRFPKRSLRR